MNITFTKIKRNCLIALLFIISNYGAHAITTGDIAVIGVNSDVIPNELTIVTLAPIPSGETIYITDLGWNGTMFSTSGAAEGTIRWTTTAIIPLGTVLKITIASGATPVVTGLPGTVTTTGWSSSVLASGGDNWFIFQGTSFDTPTTWIYGFANWATNTPMGGVNYVWVSSGTISSTTSYLPLGLVNGSSANALTGNTVTSPTIQNPHYDNMVYKGPKTGTKTQILAAIATPANWAGDETTVQDIAPGGSNFSGVNPIFTVAVPTLTSNGTIAAFTSCAGTASAAQSLSIGGANLTSNITLNATTGFEISTVLTSGYGSSVTLTHVSGVVASTPIFVRLAATATGSPTGSVSISALGAVPMVVALSGVVTSVTSPSATLTSTDNDHTICSGESVTFTATPSNAGTSPTFQWKINGNHVGTNSPTFVSNTLKQGDLITFTMTSSAACASPATVTPAGIIMNVNKPSADTLVVTACSSYMLNSQVYTTSGIYTQNLLNVHGCDSTLLLDLTILNVHTAVSMQNGTLTAINPEATYQWVDCGKSFEPILNATAQTFTPPGTGNYAVILTQNTCKDTSLCYNILVTATNDATSATHVGIYPNPCDGNFLLDLGGTSKFNSIKILNVAGKVVYASEMIGDQVASIHLDEPAGIYFLIIKVGENTEIKKLIVE